MHFQIPFLRSISLLNAQQLSQNTAQHSRPMDAWRFDVSSFMVLLREQEEFNYRHLRRTLLECFTAAPVAGMQSYLHGNVDLIESTGAEYFSPFGCKKAPLRNMRLDRMISHQGLLRDGKCLTYRVISTDDPENAANSKHQSTPLVTFVTTIWVVFTWIVYSAILAAVIIFGPDGLTWVGFLNGVAFPGWSIVVRLVDWYCLVPAKLGTGSRQSKDAVYILGRRNSGFILEGTRDQIAQWTGQGVSMRDSSFARWLCWFARAGSFFVILVVFVTLPNGSVWDQLTFIAYNLLGQANVIIGQSLAGKRCLGEFTLVQSKDVATRTHIYGLLLQKFGNTDWVEKSDLLPQTDLWKAWAQEVVKPENESCDAKELYEEIRRSTR